MKHNYSKRKYLNREEMLDAVQQNKNFPKDELSTFSERALKGMQQFEDADDLASVFNKLDSKIDQQVTAMGKTTEPEKKGSTVFLYRIAAAVALLLIATYFFLPTQNSSVDLFAANFEHLPSAIANTSLERGEHNPADLKSQAFLAYEQENYDQAIPKFESYLSTTSDLESQFYFGVALLGNGQSSEAITQLQAVKNNPPKPVYTDYANWYLALAHLQADETKTAKTILELLSENSGDFQNQAKNLLDSL